MRMRYGDADMEESAHPAATPSGTLCSLIRHAILAPSPCNLQPWRFAIRGDAVLVFLDDSRRLHWSDRTGRQATIAIGCAVENLCVAASAIGLATEMASFPEDEVAPVVARATFAPRDAPSVPPGLLSSIGRRATIRCLTPAAISHATVQRLLGCADDGTRLHFVSDRRQIAAAADLVRLASLHAMPLCARPWGTLAASRLTRSCRALILAGAVRDSSPLVVVAAPDDTRDSWLAAGRVMQRVWLTAVAEGIAMAPITDLIEHEAARRALAELVDEPPDSPMVFARLGAASRWPRRATSRKRIEDVVDLPMERL